MSSSIATDADWQRSYATIRDTHSRVYATIDTAIRCEEAETPQLAISNYRLSVLLIDEALATPVGLPADAEVVELDATWDEAIRMIQRMQRTRGELLQRIATLVAAEQGAGKPAEAAAGVAGSTSACGERPWNYSELCGALRTGAANDIATGNGPIQLIYTCDGVRLYHIRAGGGEVTTAAENSVLRILCMAGDTERRLQATFFLQIIGESLSEKASPSADEEFTTIVDGLAEGAEATEEQGVGAGAASLAFDTPWIYPLVAGVSPCYYTKFGAFIFPDLYANDESDGGVAASAASVGLVVGEEAAEEVLLEVLDAILLGVVRERRAPAEDGDEDGAGQRSRRSTSERMSDGIVAGASYISRGLLFSSTKVGEFVERNTPYVIAKMARGPAAQTDAEAPLVSRGVVTGMEVAKTATGMAASVTGYVADKVGSATMALGRYLAPHVQAKGTRLLSHTMGYSEEEAADRMSGVMIVAAGAVEGFGTVYSGLEQSAALLGTSLSNNTVRVIEHKYDASAGELAAGTFDTVGNVINISHNVSVLTPKSLVKKTAKNASKAMIQGYRPSASAGRLTVPASELLYPELGQFSRVVAAAQK